MSKLSEFAYEVMQSELGKTLAAGLEDLSLRSKVISVPVSTDESMALKYKDFDVAVLFDTNIGLDYAGAGGTLAVALVAKPYNTKVCLGWYTPEANFFPNPKMSWGALPDTDVKTANTILFVIEHCAISHGLAPFRVVQPTVQVAANSERLLDFDRKSTSDPTNPSPA